LGININQRYCETIGRQPLSDGSAYGPSRSGDKGDFQSGVPVVDPDAWAAIGPKE
jgi:hypothetical protein